MNRDISRRDMLKALALTAGSITMCGDLSGAQGTAVPPGVTETTEEEKRAFLPLIARTVPSLPPPDSRVVHVHSNSATFWSGQTDYWNYVDQGVVNNMVDQGLMALTGASSTADAWQALLPNYRVGQGIAIKVNLNNSYTSCDYTDAKIDALIQPVNAVVRGLKQIGVAEADIWIYDAIRNVPDRFVGASQYSGIRYFDTGCHEPATFQSSDANALVTFFPPSGVPTPPPTRISDVLINATHMINMPIMKTHARPGVSLAFKNHLGTIDSPWDLHDYITPAAAYYRSDYSPFVDIYQNPHIAGKTILTLGDGLFSSREGQQAPPSTWTTFGDQVPNSLFFSTNPVAAECVMADFLDAEVSLPTSVNDYLLVASDAGLGLFERGDPWEEGYTSIEYLRIEL